MDIDSGNWLSLEPSSGPLRIGRAGSSRGVRRGDREMEESENLRRATELWRAAYRYQMEGELDLAIEHYQRSIAVYLGVAEGEVEGLDLAADAFGRLLGRGPALAAATLEKAFGTLPVYEI